MGDDASIIKIGPVGSKRGDAWDEKGNTKIVQIFVSHDDEINSVQFQYADKGSLVLSERHGNSDGYNFDVVKLKYPAEYITWISGHMSYSHNRLSSITFGTNHGTGYGPFGRFTDHDKEFTLRLGDDRQFAGFHGTVDNNGVKSIGVYLKPKTALDYLTHENNSAKPAANEEAEKWELLNGLHVN